MLKARFANRFGIGPKAAAISVILVAGAFIWYFYAFGLLMSVGIPGFSISDSELILGGINIAGIAISAILSVLFLRKFKNRKTVLLYWMLLGIPISLITMSLGTQSFAILASVAAILGVYFGVGMPTCMGYFASATEPQNRARLAGITFFVTYFGFFILTSFNTGNIMFNSIVLTSVRAIGLAVLLLLRPTERKIDESDKASYHLVLSNRGFLLYFVPWVMFSLVNYMAGPITGKFFDTDFAFISKIIEGVLGASFAIVSGFIADAVGRKRLAVSAFALLGIGYAGLGLFPGNLVGWWFYSIVDGIAWGAFYTIFLITVWGDLSQGKSSERYYAIGSLPFLLSILTRLSVGDIVAGYVAESTVFSFASFFLFLAVLPLIYAPETLPEKTIRDRELKIYVEKAQKVKQKYA